MLLTFSSCNPVNGTAEHYYYLLLLNSRLLPLSGSRRFTSFPAPPHLCSVSCMLQANFAHSIAHTAFPPLFFPPMAVWLVRYVRVRTLWHPPSFPPDTDKWEKTQAFFLSLAPWLSVGVAEGFRKTTNWDSNPPLLLHLCHVQSSL